MTARAAHAASSLLLSSLLAACGGGADHATAADGGASDASSVPDAPSDPRWPACDATEPAQTISFVHVNDLHANYQLDAAGISPYARIRGYYGKVLAENPYTVFTSGGDDYEKGALAEVLSQGASTREILASMKFDVRVIGNHDYAWSEDEVLRMSHDDRASVLESNMRYHGASPIGFGAADFAALEIGCLRVGFAGMVSEPWNEQDRVVEAPFYPDFDARYDFNARAQELVDAHRGEVDLLIFVDHIGLGLDGFMAYSVPGIDAVLSGHSHDLTTTPQMANTTPIVQSGAFAQHVVRLDVTYDRAARAVTGTRFTVVDVNEALAPDAATQGTVAGVLQKYAPHATDPVAQAHDAGTAASIAALAARAAIARFGADAAVVDTQTVWNLWGAGALSDQSFLDAFKIERELPGTPGFNSFYTATVTGADLQKIQAAAGARFALSLPAAIDPAKSYLLALQKRPAYGPASFFAGVAIAAPTYGAEAWEVLDFYAQQRAKQCLYLDADVKLAGCT